MFNELGGNRCSGVIALRQRVSIQQLGFSPPTGSSFILVLELHLLAPAGQYSFRISALFRWELSSSKPEGFKSGNCVNTQRRRYAPDLSSHPKIPRDFSNLEDELPSAQ